MIRAPLVRGSAGTEAQSARGRRGEGTSLVPGLVAAMANNKGSKTRLGFAENFLISGSAAAISKTSAAPIERVKLLLQNQVRTWHPQGLNVSP